MTDKLYEYRHPTRPPEGPNILWPLYGSGMENLGRDSKAIEVPLPAYGPDELLIRHDAVGLCFSDIKVINLGQNHPRIHDRDIRQDPIVLGHEIALTVVAVGENLRDTYHVGDRFTVQADIDIKGVNFAYGYMIQGGLSKYGVIDQRVLNGDAGNYLIPVQPDTGYAEAALTEPWACVTAAYGLKYRTALKPGGTAWIIGTAAPLKSVAAGAESYRIGTGFERGSHPARLLLTRVPAAFASWLRERARELGVEVLAVDDVAAPPVSPIDDIVLLGNDPALVEAASPHLANHGICALIADEPMPRKVSIDVGRVHYNRWVYVGGSRADVARAYSDVPVRSALKTGGRAWFVGAGGPMGRMHVQRAIQVPNGPATIVCTDVSDLRLNDLAESFGEEARAKGIEFICLNPMQKEAYAAAMAPFAGGFDDIMVLAPVPAIMSESAEHLAPCGVMNVFAGVARGTMADLDVSDVYLRNVRHIGQTASSIDDLREMLSLAESGTLSPNRSVAAIGSLSAAYAGYQAVKNTSFPGKVVIYPNIKDMPLTALADLKDSLPGVYARLRGGREWTDEAEAELLRIMVED